MIKIKNIQESVDDVLTTWNELSAAGRIWINNRIQKRISRFDQDWTYGRNDFHVIHLRNCSTYIINIILSWIHQCLLVLLNYSWYVKTQTGNLSALNFANGIISFIQSSAIRLSPQEFVISLTLYILIRITVVILFHF